MRGAKSNFATLRRAYKEGPSMAQTVSLALIGKPYGKLARRELETDPAVRSGIIDRRRPEHPKLFRAFLR